MSLSDRFLPKGTVVKIEGIPVTLDSGVVATTHPENWKLIDEYSEQAQASRGQGVTQDDAVPAAVS